MKNDRNYLELEGQICMFCFSVSVLFSVINSFAFTERTTFDDAEIYERERDNAMFHKVKRC